MREQVELLEDHAGLPADLLMLRMSCVSSTPSTTMRPASCSSSRLMQRIIVDFPDPDGPITTTTSWRPTWRLMSFSAGKSPKNFIHAFELDDHFTCAGDLRRVGEDVRSDSAVAPLSHLVPTPSLRSSRRLSRLIVYDPAQNMSAAKAMVSPIRPWPRNSPLLRDRRRHLEQSNRPIAAPARRCP